MSDLAQAARVDLMMADFANADAQGKGNITGSGIAILGFDPNTKSTSRFTILVNIWVPGKMAPTEFPIEIALLNGMNNLVQLPGPNGAQPLRVAQVAQVERAQGPFSSQIKDHVGTRAQVILDFGNGLPLSPGEIYSWRVEVDGDDSVTRLYPFAVAGAPPGPVFG